MYETFAAGVAMALLALAGSMGDGGDRLPMAAALEKQEVTGF